MAIYMKRGSFEQQRWQQSMGTWHVNTHITPRWRRCNILCCNYLLCIVLRLFVPNCSTSLFHFFQQCPCLIWFAEQACKQLSARKNDPLVPHWYALFAAFFWKIAAKLHQVSSMLETLQFFSRWNCSEVAGGLHAWFEVAEWVQQRLHWKSRQNCIKNC